MEYKDLSIPYKIVWIITMLWPLYLIGGLITIGWTAKSSAIGLGIGISFAVFGAVSGLGRALWSGYHQQKAILANERRMREIWKN